MIPPELFGRAAESLRGRVPPDVETTALLAALDYDDSDPKRDQDSNATRLREHRAALLAVAARLDRIFQLDAPSAPGFFFLGGEVSPAIVDAIHSNAPKVGVTGKGKTLRAAFEGCCGEAVEYLSQLETDHDRLETLSDQDALAQLDERSRKYVERWLTLRTEPLRPGQWLSATRLSDERTAFLPAELCLRRPKVRQSFASPFLLGTGTAAGLTAEAAAEHALFELFERDALGLWWKGARLGRAIDLAAQEFRDAAALLAQLRQGRAQRMTRLLDITTDIGAPCAVAFSGAQDGGQFAFGAASRMTMAAAAQSAILEMCQLELAQHIVALKILENGEAALNPSDRAHLRRARSINAKSCPLLQPTERKELTAQTIVSSLSNLIERSARLGVEVYSIDITRPTWGIPAVRLIAPALQLEPSETISDRLAAAIAETGGGAQFTDGAPLL